MYCMKTNLLFFLCLLIAGITANAQPVTQYQKLYGGSNDDFAYGFNVKPTSDGGFIIGGTSTSTNGTLAGLTNHGGIDAWIYKTDANGNITWQKLYGGSGDDYVYSVVQTADGGYIAVGESTSSNSGTLAGLTNNGGHDAWVMKLNASGNLVWQKLLGGGSNENFYSVNQATDNGYFISGTTASSNSGTLTGINNNGSNDAWIIKLNSSGNTVWQKLLGGDGFDRFISNALTADGGYIAVGTEGSSSGSGTLTGITNHGSLDGWIVKLNASGNTTWQTTFGSSSDDQFQAVQQASDGGYIIAGSAAGENGGTFGSLTGYGAYDAWIVKTNQNGALQWQQIAGGTGYDFGQGVNITADGGYIVAAQTESLPSNAGTLHNLTQHGGYDGYVIKLDKNGNTTWQDLYGGSADDNMLGIQQTKDWGFLAQGFSASSNSGTLTGVNNNGGNDAWLVKLEAPKITITSYDTLATCASTNSITYKITQDSAPYTVQLYRFGTAYGSAKTTNSKITFNNVPSGSYYAIATSKGVTGISKTISIIPTPTNPNTSKIKSTQAKLNWDAVPCADYYSIQYRVHGTVEWSKKKTDDDTTSYVLKKLLPSTSYDWEVAAVISLNGINATSAYTDSAVFVTSASFASGDTNETGNLTAMHNDAVRLVISPNPVKNSFKIQFNTMSLYNRLNAMLYDANGKAVWSSGLISSESLNGKQVNVSRFAKGVYYLKIITENGIIKGSTKIIIQQ